MTVVTLRAWVVAVLALLAAGAGVSALSGGAASSSLLRLGFAAAVLSVYAAVAALVTTRRESRTPLRCAVWGGAVPLAVGVVTLLLVAARAGAVAGAVNASPWLLGVLAAVLLGPWLPAFRWPRR